jgi:eukaryotic-like serine/threonine-protein kinase
MSNDKLEKKERFGRYLILDHLVNGGMAKICRARFLGEQADKIVAIKMVQPQFSKDKAFEKMFMDEIKVTFGLHHPNIVQTYDYGINLGQLFVAMEYCDGRNLREYLERLRQKKFVFPVEISVYIISQVCQALHYAHMYTDKLTGKAANIIHRDISPHNIMLTYDGSVKIIDFGIAKAETNQEATQAGTIKGKLSYLAPEYIEGYELDHRYDQFAVGITLWELLCSRKLFKAANDLAVLKKIQECKIPAPSTVNPNVPKALDEIVMKALSKDRTKRFENMDQLNRALIKFLYANYPDFNSSDLSYFAKELFKEEIKKDREKLFEYGKINLRPYLDDLKRDSEGPREEYVDGGDPNDQRKRENVLDFGFQENEDDPKTTNKVKRAASENNSRIGPPKDEKRASKNKRVDHRKSLSRVKGNDDSLQLGKMNQGLKVGENIMGGAAPAPQKRSRSESSQRSRNDETATNTSVALFRKEEGRKKVLSFAIVGAIFLAYVFGKNVLKENQKPQTVVATEIEPTPTLDDSGILNEERNSILPSADNLVSRIRLKNFDRHSQKVFINDKQVEVDILKQVIFENVNLKPGETASLRIEESGKKHFVTQITFNDGKTQVISIDKMPKENYGYIYTSFSCRMFGKLHFELYGEKRSVDLPLRTGLGLALPIRGDGRMPASNDGKAIYTIYFEKRGESIKRKIEFKFDSPDQRLDLCKR